MYRVGTPALAMVADSPRSCAAASGCTGTHTFANVILTISGTMPVDPLTKFSRRRRDHPDNINQYIYLNLSKRN
jgi:hypothetical protein